MDCHENSPAEGIGGGEAESDVYSSRNLIDSVGTNFW